MAKILISGYYGFDNAGDDAVLFGIISSLKKIDPTIEIAVLSNQPEKTEQLFQVPAFNRWSFNHIFSQIRKADLVILGGGTLLQDRTSPRSPLYYLGITLLAKMMGKPVFYYGQGFGPIVHSLSKRMIRLIVNRVNRITVRDQESGEELKAHGVTKAPIHVTADPALTIHPDEVNRDEAEKLIESYKINRKKPIAFVAIRDWKQEQQFKKELAISLDRLSEEGWQVVFIAMQHPNDLSPSLDTIQHMNHPAVLIDQPLNFKEIMSLISLGQLMIGMRLHALILAAIVNVPFVALSYDPKIDRFVESVGRQSTGHISSLNAERLMNSIMTTISNLEAEKENLFIQTKPIIEKAHENARLVFQILNKKG
jgi:polysaccharide pyruvyl transferase CsaB